MCSDYRCKKPVIFNQSEAFVCQTNDIYNCFNVNPGGWYRTSTFRNVSSFTNLVVNQLGYCYSEN